MDTSYEWKIRLHLPGVDEEFCFGTRVGGSKAHDMEQESPLHSAQIVAKDYGRNRIPLRANDIMEYPSLLSESVRRLVMRMPVLRR
jgi:hypothetical protein